MKSARIITGVVLLALTPCVLAQHARDGQCIFYNDGHVKWQTAPTPSPREKPPIGPETVWTRSGDVLNGTVLGIDADSTLRLSGSSFLGHVAVQVASIGRVRLRASLRETGRDEVFLTNGDHLCGKLVEISAGAVTLETDITGVLRFPRPFVASIIPACRGDCLVESCFSSGRLTPWKVRTGPSPVVSGRLLLGANGHSRGVYAEVSQEGAVTFVVRLKADPSGPFQCGLVIFAEQLDGGFGKESIAASVTKGKWFLGGVHEDRADYRFSGSVGRSMTAGELRLAYDPKTHKAMLWRDSVLLAECVVAEGPAKGRYVMFRSQYACEVERLRVLRGIVPPSVPERPPGKEQHDLVVFRNGDRVSAREIVLSAGKYVIDTEFGRVTPVPGTVEWIGLRQSGRRKPPSSDDDMRVLVHGGRLALRLDRLTDHCVEGRSPCCGDVRIRRRAVRDIRSVRYVAATANVVPAPRLQMGPSQRAVFFVR